MSFLFSPTDGRLSPTVTEVEPIIMASSHLSSPETDPSERRKVNDLSINVKCVMRFLTVRLTDTEKNYEGPET